MEKDTPTPLQLSVCLLIQAYLCPPQELEGFDAAESERLGALVREWTGTRQDVQQGTVGPDSVLESLFPADYHGMQRQIDDLGQPYGQAVMGWLTQVLCSLDTPDALCDLVDELQVLAQHPGLPGSHDADAEIIDPRAPVARFLARFIARFEGMYFSGVVRLYEDLLRFLDGGKSPSAGRQPTALRTAAGAGIVPPLIEQERLTQRASELELRLALAASKSMEADIDALLAECPDMPRAHYLAYTYCMLNKDFDGAISSLHRFFDFSARPGGPSPSPYTTPFPDTGDLSQQHLQQQQRQLQADLAGGAALARSRVAQHSALCLAALHLRLGHAAEGMREVEAALSLAQQSGDATAEAYALAWLARAAHATRAPEASMLLRKCLSQAGAQGQLPLVCSCALQLVQDRLLSDVRMAAWETGAAAAADAWEEFGATMLRALAAHPAVASSQAAARLPTAAPAPLPALATTSVQERQQMVREEQLLRARTYTVHGHAALACTSLLTVLQVSLHPAAPPARDGVASATGAPVAIALRVSADDHSSLRAACQLAGLLASTNPQLRETMALAGAAALLPASATAAEEAVTAEASAQRDALTELRRALSDIPSSPRRSAHTCALRILLAARAAFPVFVTGEPTWALAVGTVLFERAVVREQAVEAAALAEELEALATVQSDDWAAASAQLARARAVALGGDPEAAVDTLHAVAERCVAQGLPLHHCQALLATGAVWLDCAPHKPSVAVPPLLQCMAAAEAAGFHTLHAEALATLARAQLLLGLPAQALAAGRAALPQLRAHGSSAALGAVLATLARAEVAAAALATAEAAEAAEAAQKRGVAGGAAAGGGSVNLLAAQPIMRAAAPSAAAEAQGGEAEARRALSLLQEAALLLEDAGCLVASARAHDDAAGICGALGDSAAATEQAAAAAAAAAQQRACVDRRRGGPLQWRHDWRALRDWMDE